MCACVCFKKVARQLNMQIRHTLDLEFLFLVLGSNLLDFLHKILLLATALAINALIGKDSLKLLHTHLLEINGGKINLGGYEEEGVGGGIIMVLKVEKSL